MLHDAPAPSLFQRLGRLSKLVLLLWVAVLLGVSARAIISPRKNTVVTTYRLAGERWLASKNLYKGKRGFVYSPPAAAAFVPLVILPKAPSEVLWRLLNAGALLGGVGWWLRAGLSPGIPPRLYLWIFLLLLPLSLGNLNNGQVNPLMIGLIMMAFAACRQERWWIAAFCIAVGTYLKIYPLAVGLLLGVVYPRVFSWRLAVALVALAVASFGLQNPAYVAEQYRNWFATRAVDDRFAYADSIAPRDLWMLFRLVQLPISKGAYQGIQFLSGMAIAGVLLYGRWQRWSPERLLWVAFALGCSWMLLCGPATESATYVFLAPAAALALVEAFAQPASRLMRGWIVLVLVILLGALGMNSFLKLPKNVYTMSVQPMAAFLFCGYVLAGIAKDLSIRSSPVNGRPGHPFSARIFGDMLRQGKTPRRGSTP